MSVVAKTLITVLFINQLKKVYENFATWHSTITTAAIFFDENICSTDHIKN